MGKGTATDVPPPGAGVTTVTAAVPAAAISLAEMLAWSWVALTNVVVRAAPFQRTPDEGTKLFPVTVKVNAVPPAAALLGVSALSAGVGLVAVTPAPLPVTIAEMTSPFAVKLTFVVTVAVVVGLNRTVTVWLAPAPTRLNGLPETMLKGAATEAVPDTVPPLLFCTTKVRSTELPSATLPKLVVPVGVTANSLRATALPRGVAQALSLPPESTAVTDT
jgi:hypothetical protein